MVGKKERSMKNIFRTELGDACTTLVDIIHHYTKAESVSRR